MLHKTKFRVIVSQTSIARQLERVEVMKYLGIQIDEKFDQKIFFFEESVAKKIISCSYKKESDT
jgi:hypothetical protein